MNSWKSINLTAFSSLLERKFLDLHFRLSIPFVLVVSVLVLFVSKEKFHYVRFMSFLQNSFMKKLLRRNTEGRKSNSVSNFSSLHSSLEL
jgi:hypothetical protein